MVMIHVKLMTFMFLMQAWIYGNFVSRYMVLIHGTISLFSLSSRHPLMFSNSDCGIILLNEISCTLPCKLSCTDDWNDNHMYTWHHPIAVRRHTMISPFFLYFFFFFVYLFVFVLVLITMCSQQSRVIPLKLETVNWIPETNKPIWVSVSYRGYYLCIF